MAISTLKDIAFFNIITTVLKSSNMEKEITLYAFHGAKNGVCSNGAEKARSLITYKTEKITKFILSNTEIPKKLKMKLIVINAGLICELTNWALVIANTLTEVTKKHVYFCVNRIVINNGCLDKIASALKILEDSMFLLKLDKEYLALSYIHEETLKTTAEKILNTIENKSTVTTPLSSSVDVSLVKKAINELLSGYCSSLWIIDLSKSFNKRVCTALEYVASLKNCDNLKHYCKYVDDGLEERDYFEAAAFAISENSCDVESMVFLYHHCCLQNWVKLLRKFCVEMISIVLRSWRHRHLAIEWFRLVKDYCTSDTLIDLFESDALNFGYSKYERYDILPVMVNIFFEAPDPLKFNEKFFYHVLADRLVFHGDDVEYFYPVIDYYDDEKKVQLLARIIINFILSNKEDLIPECLMLLPKLKLNVDTYKNIIGHSEIKQELLALWSKPFLRPYNDYLGYCQQLEKALKNPEEVQLFKSEVLNDKIYMLKYIEYHSLECYTFLQWCHNGNNEETEKYRSQLLNEGIIQQAYEHIIVKHSNLNAADNMLKAFSITSTICNVIKRETLASDSIKKIILFNFFKDCNTCAGFDTLHKDWRPFFSDEDDEKEFFRNLFLSDVGRDALIEFISQYKLEDDELCLHSPVTNTLERFFHIKVVFESYDLLDEVHEMLLNYGNPYEIGSEKTFPASLSPTDLNIARMWVNFNYLAFTIILSRDVKPALFSALERRQLHDIINDMIRFSERENDE